MAVRLERAHAKLVSAGEGLPVVGFGLHDIGGIGVGTWKLGVLERSITLHSFTFLMVGMLMAGTSGRLLFNAEEADILLHRPVTPRALLAAKVWVLVVLGCTLAVALNVVGLGLGVCGRSYYLCISLHNVEGFRSIFGPYFLIPFGFAIATLLLEGGLTSGRKGVTRFALMMPIGLVALSIVGHRPDVVYSRFLAMFREGLGVAPPAASMILALVFYGLAAVRRVPMARGLTMGVLVALSVVGPRTMGPSRPSRRRSRSFASCRSPSPRR